VTSAASLPGALASELATIVSAIDRLARIDEIGALMREAVEFARGTLGIERISIYLVESTEPQVFMRGTWGTSDRGVTTDERGLAHVYANEDFQSLQTLHARGELWDYRSLDSQDNDRRRLPWTREDRDWLATTPLVFAGEVIGVFYNDTAISRAPLDGDQQAKLAIFASLLAGVARERLGERVERARPPVPMTSRFIQKVLYDLEREPHLSGEELAQRFRVSAGHLARTFKAEVGSSLVEYRNRMRLERFFAAMRTGQPSMQEAATQAGFGSYAQFLRVHRQLTGLAPREYSSTAASEE
jgi:methylphosphotriester-DNA--protein-cysteine methyltransferase